MIERAVKSSGICLFSLYAHARFGCCIDFG